MATIAELLTSSLNALEQVQRGEDFTIIKSSDLSRAHIKRLVGNHSLKPITKGWYVATDPRATPGDSTVWYASFWSFITRYVNERYDNEWCLLAEQSLSIYTGATIIPNQVLIRAPKGNDYTVPLIPPASVFNLGAELPSKIDTNNPYNLNLHTLAEVTIVATPAMYHNDALTMRAALATVHDSSDVLKILVDTGQTVRTNRVIGAFRDIGRTDMVDEIAGTMKRMGYIIYEEDPFERVMEIHVSQSPHAVRLHLMWQNMREDVIANFTRFKSNLSAKELLERTGTQYKLNAYHSLSIEGYRVTDELMNKVKSGVWKPDGEDMDSKSVPAACGYWQAFQEVKKNAPDISEGGNSAEAVERDLSVWHSEMFIPCVTTGTIKPSDIVGCRSHQAHIRNSMHTPLNPDALHDAMTTLFELLREEPEACVRAVLRHFLFTYIHPFVDRNGRVGRFLMNAMLASGGYDWLTIPVERRDEYIAVLEKASVEEDVVSSVRFLSSI